MSSTAALAHLTNLDANEALFFEQELEHIKAKTYDVMRRELRHREYVPVSNEAGPGAETISYYQYDQVGTAKLISNYADDLPLANVKGKKFSAPVHSMGIGFAYSVQDIRASQMANKRLEQRDATAAARAVAELEESICAFGDANTGMLGFLNHPNVPIIQAADPGGGRAWIADDKTPEEITKDMGASVQSILDTTSEKEKPNAIILPTLEYGHIAQTKMTSIEPTILKWFLTNNPWIQSVGTWDKLKTADDAGTGPRMVTYRRDPDALQLEIPQEFEIFPVQQHNLVFLTPTHARIGGVSFFYPLSAVYTDDL
ncbi:MAG TPA: encapsulin [Thermoanaerobaculia bacterium]|nr:encapsulin [Thermoanaerobaculia bacterium]